MVVPQAMAVIKRSKHMLWRLGGWLYYRGWPMPQCFTLLNLIAKNIELCWQYKQLVH